MLSNISHKPKQEGLEQRPQVPNLDFYTTDNKKINLNTFKEKVVLLSFWASWCGPCKEELPSFEKLVQSINSKDFIVVPINLDTNPEDAKNFIAKLWPQHSISFPSYFDSAMDTAKQMNIEVLPANFVLDKNLKEVMASSGLHDWNSASTVKLIQELLAE